MNYSLGGLPSPYDYRDIPFSAVAAVVPVPAAYTSPIRLFYYDQRALGACVGHAGAEDNVKNEYFEKQTVVDFSPRFIYALCKMIDGYPGQGTYPRTMMSQRMKYGIATEATCPNDTMLDHETYVYNRNFNLLPAAALAEAKQYAIKGYANLALTAAEFKQAIFQSGGICLLITVTQDWFNYKVGDMPRVLPSVGNHEVFLYKYTSLDNGYTRFHGVNSWGQQWGINGEFDFIFEEWQSAIVEALTSVDLPDDWLNEVHALPPAPVFKHAFNTNLSFGMKSEEVRQLQIALKIEGTFPASTAETGYFGTITKAAVIGFQHKYQIPPLGLVGPITRARLNSLYNK